MLRRLRTRAGQVTRGGAIGEKKFGCLFIFGVSLVFGFLIYFSAPLRRGLSFATVEAWPMRPLILALVILAGGIPAHADVTGKPRVIVGDTIEIAVCYAGGYDLNAKMVRQDWALAYR